MSTATSTGTSLSNQREIGGRGLRFRDLEGREVSIALADGSRLDAVTLVSAGRGQAQSVWVYSGGMDIFVPRPNVVDVWESPSARAA